MRGSRAHSAQLVPAHQLVACTVRARRAAARELTRRATSTGATRRATRAVASSCSVERAEMVRDFEPRGVRNRSQLSHVIELDPDGDRRWWHAACNTFTQAN